MREVLEGKIGQEFRRVPVRRVPVQRSAPVYGRSSTYKREDPYYRDYTKEDEIEDLKAYFEELEKRLESVEEKLGELTE
ncbi:MAG: hypothetical protein BTN85_1236 [Candidatus Methanohalarchaeum thermophilum]|uniref:Uncharacterized protein n=1 Tax=Methanohalarchaeum thermophilum TaxID=1903181 RepID=A0A1Q6DWL1_METT1|nr:MAG: hypothetical protein BTN85_1236 [Candidatus Methanohalarchaeum thermophilum]